MLRKTLCLIFAASAVLAGCTGLQTSSDISSQDSGDKMSDTALQAPVLPPADIEPDILYGLLVAEEISDDVCRPVQPASTAEAAKIRQRVFLSMGAILYKR